MNKLFELNNYFYSIKDKLTVGLRSRIVEPIENVPITGEIIVHSRRTRLNRLNWLSGWSWLNVFNGVHRLRWRNEPRI